MIKTAGLLVSVEERAVIRWNAELGEGRNLLGLEKERRRKKEEIIIWLVLG